VAGTTDTVSAERRDSQSKNTVRNVRRKKSNRKIGSSETPHERKMSILIGSSEIPHERKKSIFNGRGFMGEEKE